MEAQQDGEGEGGGRERWGDLDSMREKGRGEGERGVVVGRN